MKIKKILKLNTKKSLLVALSSLSLVAGSGIGVVATSTKLKTKNSASNFGETNDGSNDHVDMVITQEQYDDFVVFVRNAIAAKMSSIDSIYNGHQVWIRNIVGTFLANVKNYDPTKPTIDEINHESKNHDQKLTQRLQKNSDSTPQHLTPQKILQMKYQYVIQQASQLGVSTVDYSYIRSSFMPRKVEDFAKAVNYDDKKVSDYKSAMTNALITSKQRYYDMYGYSTEMAVEGQNAGFTPPDPNNPYEDKVLIAAAHEHVNVTSNRMKMKEDTSAFTHLVSGYSADGHYKAGDEIAPEDFQYLYDYKYDVSNFGQDFSKYVPDDIDTYKATKAGEYDQNIINYMYVTKSFGGFHSEDSSVDYGTGEIIPGILLHAKILSLDTDTNSHKCIMKVVFGVSNNTEIKKVYWIGGDEKTQSFMTAEQKNEIARVEHFELEITDIAQRKYIATNTYYKDWSYDVTVKHDNDADGVADHDAFSYRDNYDPSGGGSPITIFGLDDWKERSKLDAVLDKYQASGPNDQDYDFANNPIYITVGTGYFGNPTSDDKLTGDFYGIPLPTNFSSSEFAKIKHSHQQLAIKISDVNTLPNYNCLTINWCYIDEDAKIDIPSVDDGQVKSGSKYTDVYDLQWKINEKWYNTINLFYHIDEQTQGIIDEGLTIGDAISTLADTTDKYVKYFNHIDLSAIKNYFSWNNKVDLGTACLSVISAITSAWNAFCYFIGKKSAMDLIKMTAGIAVTAACSIAIAFQVIQEKKDEKMFNKMERFYNAYTLEDSVLWRNMYKDIEGDVNILNDKHGTYKAKKNATFDIEKIFCEYFPIIAEKNSQEEKNKDILTKELNVQYDVNTYDEDTSGSYISKDEYVKNAKKLLFGTAPQITSDLKITSDIGKEIIARLAEFQSQSDSPEQSLVEFIDTCNGRVQYYIDSGLPILRTGTPSYNWSQLTNWTNIKRIVSNAKNILYYARDFANNIIEGGAGGKWSEGRQLLDFYTITYSKFLPETNSRFIATFIVAKGTDSLFKAQKAWQTYQQFKENGSNLRNEFNILRANDSVYFQAVRFIVTILSTFTYWIQEILDSTVIPQTQ